MPPTEVRESGSETWGLGKSSVRKSCFEKCVGLNDTMIYGSGLSMYNIGVSILHRATTGVLNLVGQHLLWRAAHGFQPHTLGLPYRNSKSDTRHVKYAFWH